jgi:hypothetical protein
VASPRRWRPRSSTAWSDRAGTKAAVERALPQRPEQHGLLPAQPTLEHNLAAILFHRIPSMSAFPRRPAHGEVAFAHAANSPVLVLCMRCDTFARAISFTPHYRVSVACLRCDKPVPMPCLRCDTFARTISFTPHYPVPFPCLRCATLRARNILHATLSSPNPLAATRHLRAHNIPSRRILRFYSLVCDPTPVPRTAPSRLPAALATPGIVIRDPTPVPRTVPSRLPAALATPGIVIRDPTCCLRKRRSVKRSIRRVHADCDAFAPNCFVKFSAR